MARSEKHPQQDLHVEWELVGVEAGKEQPKLAAYAFSTGGKLLDRKPLGEKSARLSVPVGAEATGVRVMVGPEVENATADELIRRGAMEQHLRIEPKNPRLIARFTVLEPIWLCWLRSACVVRGTLVKRVTSGGVSLDLPVCNATVDIYEVDTLLFLLPRLPLEIINRIRQIVIDPRPPVLQLESAPRPPSAPVEDSRISTALREATASGASSLKLVAQTGSRQAFEKVLVEHAEVARLILCHYFPLLLTMHKVATVSTNDCGHFQALFFQGCNNHDVPDLYFKAHQRLFGFFDVTIYAPTPIASHTFWNYQCGTEVTLVTTHPLAITCSPCPPVNAPENWVLFTAVGNTSLKAIFGGGAAGATSTNWGLSSGGAPWGGTLRPRLDFDNSLRESLGVKYYQLSWRRGTSGSWTPLNAEVSRHYAHFVGTDLVISPYRLGPNPMVVGGQTRQLYEIPPAVPPIGQWTVADAMLDTENGEFDSMTHARGLAYNEDGTVVTGTVDESGLYQLKLDLYDASGNLIDIAAKGIKYVVPDSASLSGTISTVNANTVAQPDGSTLLVGNSMVLTLHVDNNHCWAELGAPFTPSGTADPCCGIVKYQPGASVTLPYVSFHPHGFATHSIYVFRSATTILSPPSGGVGSFTIVRLVSDMMSLNLPPGCTSGPPCTTAAFGEHLEVYAMATDGWGSSLGLNDVDDRAFALAHP